MAVHEIKVQRETLHGTFCRDIEPILTIESGDTVRYATLDAGWKSTSSGRSTGCSIRSMRA